ncbi:MAG: 4Fe-4S dicluster domain-containing protein [Fimbriimonas ginsengisoli]|uniref:4Fe-4S dicluster domain-containing protein n=1 Tax=Fimbriimonas ginsengisoli TaxID=1005039 RepID=A0A931LYQ6_FIMGI|nr:4Fe-4S dicluster domain-containing protein [Fimbriimonas ginsengisoli]
MNVCPTGAIQLSGDPENPDVSLDRGLCVTCGACIAGCPTQTIVADPSTKSAVIHREELVLYSKPTETKPIAALDGVKALGPFRRSVDVRVVSTGCNATDLEVAATANAIFDCSRFGIHFVASPRFADVLLVTGPVGRAMQKPLVSCFEAMADPRVVIAVGTCAISGGVHRGGYADANGVMPHLEVHAFVPGCPPHPWSIVHGILIATRSKATNANHSPQHGRG